MFHLLARVQRSLGSAIMEKRTQDTRRQLRQESRDALHRDMTRGQRRTAAGKAQLESAAAEKVADILEEAGELVALGRCMRALDRPSEAVTMFEAALRIAPNHASALAERAKSGAMFAFRRAVAVCAEREDWEAKVQQRCTSI